MLDAGHICTLLSRHAGNKAVHWMPFMIIIIRSARVLRGFTAQTAKLFLIHLVLMAVYVLMN